MDTNPSTPLSGNILPPHDIAAEESVIGSLVLAGELIINIGRLMPADFYHEPLGIVFNVCQTLYHRQEVINQITIASELDRIGKLEECGGVAYLSYLITVVPSPLDIDTYADVVMRHAVSRKAIVLGQKIGQVGYEANPDPQITVEKIADLVSTFRKTSGKFGAIITPRDSADMMLEMLHKYQHKRQGFSWGYGDLDYVSSGIHPSEFYVIGARPGIGKTQVMLDVADHVDRQHKKILFVSAEMSMEHLLERKVAKLLHKHIRELRKGEIKEDDERIIVDAAGIMSESNIYWMAANASSHEIYDEAARLQQQVGLDVVFIDYLQKLADCYGERENQNIRVGRACKVLKDLSFDLNVPVILASQLSREIEHRPEDEQEPNLSDLRDSGAIEQDADVVFLLHRYKGKEPTNDGGIHDPSILYVKQAKHRQLGTAQAIRLRWNEDQHQYTSYLPENESSQQEGLFED